MIIKFAAGVKKSKEIVENWNQRFPDTKALISIVNFDSGNLKITNLDRLFFTKNGEFTI